MNTELQKHSVKSLVESPAYSSRLRDLLGARAPQFVTSLVQISQTWGLSKCEPNSVIAAGMTAAALDLPISPTLGFAYVIPYGDKAQFQLGYKGLVQLALRSGQYKRLNVANVFDGELLRYDRVKGDVILDESKRKSDKVIGYVAYFELTNGAEHAEYWTVDAVMAHAKRFSQAYRSGKKDSPWITDPDAMGQKTVLKSLISKWGPLSVQLQMAVVEDQGIRSRPDSELTYPDNVAPIVETAPDLGDAPKKGKKATAAPPETVSNPNPVDSFVANGSPKADGINQLLTAGVTYDDFAGFVETQGVMRNIRDYPCYEDTPAVLWESLLSTPEKFKRIIKLYGKAAV